MSAPPFLSVAQLSCLLPSNMEVGPIALQIGEGEKLAIVGETGSGKSTLLKMLAGLVQPSSGHIYLKGQPLKGPFEKLIAGYPHIGYLSQHYHLHNNYQVAEIIDYGSFMNPQEQQQLLALCQIDHLTGRKTNSGLSGGEKQRIALAKLLAQKPTLLLLDEPYSNLDAIHKSTIKHVIRQISQQLNITCVLVSHDATDVLSWADRIIVLQQGKIVQQGLPQDLYHAPESEYVAGLFGPFSVVKTHLISTLFPDAIGPYMQEEIVVRPSFWQVSKNPANGEPVTITAVEFLGHSYLMHAMLKDSSILLQTTDDSLANDSVLFVQPAAMERTQKTEAHHPSAKHV